MSNRQKSTIERNKEIMFKKAMRHAKRAALTIMPTVTLGNKDSGVPFSGKDRFSGQRRSFHDRSFVSDKMHYGSAVITLIAEDRNYKYDTPHQGQAEKARRVKQAQRLSL
jgi:hypothetical protein